MMPKLAGFNYLVLLFTSMGLLRPVRDKLVVVYALNEISWVFTLSGVCTILFIPLLIFLVRKLHLQKFIMLCHIFFGIVLMLFQVSLSNSLSIVFVVLLFILINLFNLLFTTLFWAGITRIATDKWAKNNFVKISKGATLGSLAGPLIILLVSDVKILLLLSASLQILSCTTVRHGVNSITHNSNHSLTINFMGSIGVFTMFYSLIAAFLYVLVAHFINASPLSKEGILRLFAIRDLAINLLTLILQFKLAEFFVTRGGVQLSVLSVPITTIILLLAISIAPTLSLLIGLQVFHRAGNLAITKPAREIMFTALKGPNRFSLKSLVDIGLYRIGDIIGAWLFVLTISFTNSMSNSILAAVFLSCIWFIAGIKLGRRHDELVQKLK